ncbi:MAG: sulfite exporter TauE/SafE family protein [Hyphomicrobiales bacterium]
MTFLEILLLIIAGGLVGFINTLAGGGSIISLSALMFLGLSPTMANGTNRIAITIQTLTASASFKKKKVLDTKKALKVAIPEIIGSIIGAYFAVDIPENIFKYIMGGILLVLLIVILIGKKEYLHGREELVSGKVKLKHYILFFFIGIYGGFIHVGIGYFLLAAIILGLGYDLVKANAIKVFLVLLYAPFTLAVFLIEGQINWTYGLTMTIGSVIGAYIASHLAVKKGVEFIKWVIVAIILFTSAHLFGIIDFKTLISL